MTRNNLKILTFFLFLVGFANPAAIAQRFFGGLAGGFNLAELEGTGIDSYLGINAGGLVGTKIGKNWTVTMELLYSQDGEYLLPEFYPNVEYKKIRLDYIEIPLHLDYWPAKNKEKGYNEWNLSLGLAYAYLFNYHAEDVEEKDYTDQIIWDNTSAILMQGGATYFFNSHFGLNFRGTLSTDSSVLGWTLAFRGVYMF